MTTREDQQGGESAPAVGQVWQDVKVSSFCVRITGFTSTRQRGPIALCDVVDRDGNARFYDQDRSQRVTTTVKVSRLGRDFRLMEGRP